MEHYLGEVLGTGLGVVYTTLSTPYWPELSCMATENCREGWKYSQGGKRVLRRERRQVWWVVSATRGVLE